MDARKKVIKYLIVGFLFGLGCLLLNITSDIRQRNYQFSGIIQTITYNDKEIPEVKIAGKSYGLSTNWRFNEKMTVGDSLIKEKGSTSYKLIKRNTGKVIFLDKI